ncbi:MAG: GIY-YIG nuclease family protein [Pseudomonadota bacterium]
MARFDLIAAYIMANRKNGTLYVGVTSDLSARIEQHKSGEGSHFTGKYGCTKLVWYEEFSDMSAALQREKRLKEWKRHWKIELIEKTNPHWDDLSLDWL